MQVNEIKKDGLMRNYEFIIDGVHLHKQINKYLVSIGTKIQGFRKIKKNEINSLSDSMIAARAAKLRLMYKDHMKSICNDVIKQEIMNEILSKRSESPVYVPDISFEYDDVNKEKLSVDVKFEVFPDDIPNTPEDLSIDSATRYIAKVSDKDVNEMLKEEKSKIKKYIVAKEDHVFSSDDLAVINMFAKYKNEEHELLSNFEANSKNLTPEFFSKLNGHKKGDDVEFTIKMPEDFSQNIHARKIAGKEVDYKIHILSIKTPQEFEIDDEFARAYKFKDLEDMKAGFKKNLEERISNMSKSIMNREIEEKIKNVLKFEVPDRVLNSQKEALEKSQKNQSENKLDGQSKSEEDSDKKSKKSPKSGSDDAGSGSGERSGINPKNIDEEALKRSRFTMFMSQFMNKNIRVSDEEIRMAYLMSGKQGDYNSIKSLLSEIKFRDALTKFVKKINEKEVSFNELKDLAVGKVAS